jgi:hypothetical protein
MGRPVSSTAELDETVERIKKLVDMNLSRPPKYLDDYRDLLHNLQRVMIDLVVLLYRR